MVTTQSVREAAESKSGPAIPVHLATLGAFAVTAGAIAVSLGPETMLIFRSCLLPSSGALPEFPPMSRRRPAGASMIALAAIMLWEHAA